MASAKKRQCNLCGKTIAGGSTHMRHHINGVHLKLRPFKCTFCEQYFSVNSNRRSHELKHHLKFNPNFWAKLIFKLWKVNGFYHVILFFKFWFGKYCANLFCFFKRLWMNSYQTFQVNVKRDDIILIFLFIMMSFD